MNELQILKEDQISNETQIVRWGIQFLIQQVPTWHTFGGPRSTKKKIYMKKCDVDAIITFFHVFRVFRRAMSTKIMPSG